MAGNDKNSLFGLGHRDPKNSGGDRVPASKGNPFRPRQYSTRSVMSTCGAAFRQTSLLGEAFNYFLTRHFSRVWGGRQYAKKRCIGGH